MRAVVQRVSEASVRVETEVIGRIGRGLLVLLGVSTTDTEKDVDYLSEKVVHLRIFEDPGGKLNRSLLEVGGEMLVVSQFTLLGDCRKGRRPSFTAAAEPGHAARLYEHFVRQTARRGVPVQTGRFQALMAVSLVNDGPVTLIVDSVQNGN
ncbi:MAG: dtd [Deltaproteobacteria bacterium]|nr:dtd [Deltaproteobacteria bacterium]